MIRTLLLLAGILAFLFGILFLLQGLGVIRWPLSSMMIDNQVWVVRGGVLALLGAVLVAGTRLLPSRRR
ncbi:hypothetical protein [Sphingomonas sp. M1-B02]|uniref:hypothetical protein n=1 Tax=Sphingomonas sp. M1-B02 TaxID=3114300 RepID=UPI002240091C|nr:hypothetical protein [Sphingomonas sp. S6-11]UZK67120.1 hypothetical protein OKW87_04625 [Sphingomonas sp. S6-11]